MGPSPQPEPDAGADGAPRATPTTEALPGAASAGTPSAPPSAFAPLRHAVFRSLWLTWAAANLTMWMNDVAAAWLMTSLSNDPALVSLVQAASTLPVFLLGLPSGALADILDRRRYYAATQLWVSAVALVLAGMALVDGLTPARLLALTFANGIGLALRWPVFSAIVPAVVGKRLLAPALALNGISMNLARVVGPMLAGALLASFGVASVFALNAVLAVAAAVLILRWRSQPQTSALPGERFVGAMRVGLQHAAASPALKLIILRVFCFFLQAAGIMALLPLVARAHGGAGPSVYTVMLACTGLGAIAAAFGFPWLRRRFDEDAFLRGSTFLHAIASAAAVLAPTLWIALPALVLIGATWIAAANTLAVAAQLALPDWVRARGMSIYQMALMGGSALGAIVWGQVAARTSIATAVCAAGIAGSLYMLATARWRVPTAEGIDHTPHPLPPPVPPEGGVSPLAPDAGPVMVMVEYRVDPARQADFRAVMQATRDARKRQGVLSWGLFRDIAQPDRWIEYFVDENWVEHQRRLARFTEADVQLRARRLGLHLGTEPPIVQRLVADDASPVPVAPPATGNTPI